MRLLLVDDNNQLCRLLERKLPLVGLDVDAVGTAEAARHALIDVRYAAVVLGLELPDADGRTVLRDLRGRRDPTPVLIVTARPDVAERVEVLQEGADDVMVKPVALLELIERVRALLRRPSDQLGSTVSLGNLILDTGAGQVFVDGQPVIFSAREVALLELLLRRAPNLVAKQHIRERLTPRGTDLSLNAVEVAIHRLRRRLEEAGATVRVRAMDGGYRVTALA